MKNTIEKIKEINELCKKLQNNKKEYVEEDLMMTAKNVVDHIYPSTTEEAFLYASSLNVLNTYVKQPNASITYYFKEKVIDVLVRSIIDNKIDNIDFYLTTDRNMTICYLKIVNVMFSFHQVRVSNEMYLKIREYKGYKRLVFDNVKKQACSVSLYQNALSLS